MRTSKKIVSLILAVMMVVSMMSVMAVSAGAVGTVIHVTTASELTEALASAESGSTIKIDNDINDASVSYSNDTRFAYFITGKSSLTIDGQNNTVTVGRRGFGVAGDGVGADITFKDITIVNNASASNNYGRAIDTRGSKISTLTLDHVTLNCTHASNVQALTIGGNQASTTTVNIINESQILAEWGYAITTFNPVNMTIDNSTVTGWGCLNIKKPSSSAGSAGSVFNIVNGSVLNTESKHSGATNDFCAIKIEDDDITVNITDSTVNVDDNNGTNGQVIVAYGDPYDHTFPEDTAVNLGEGNTVNLEGDLADYEYNKDNGENNEIVISGGTFNTDIPVELLSNTADVTENLDGSVSVVTSENTYVARVGYTGYETLQDAIVAAQDGDTVTLLGDIALDSTITVDKDVTIDFYGHTVTATIHKGIVNNGTLTLTNSARLSGGIKGETNIGLVENKGTLNIEDGLYEYDGTNSSRCAFYNADGATMNINGGTISSYGYGIWTYGAGSVVNMNDGYIVSQFASAISGNGTAKYAGYTININGGTVWSLMDTAVYHPNTGTLNVTDGYIWGETGIYTKAGTTNISGGDIQGMGAAADYEYNGNGTNPTGDAFVVDSCNYPGNTPEVSITGGTFTSASSNAVASYTKQDDPRYSTASEPKITSFVSGGTFSDNSTYEYVANDAFVITDAEGNTTVSETAPTTATAIEADDQLGVSAQNITNHAILGYQNAAVTSNAAYENKDCVRIITAVNEGFLKGDNIADYGYVVAKYNGSLSNADLSTPMANILKYNNDNFKRISCYGTSNTVATEAAYGDFNADSTYKFVTLAIGDMNYGDKVIARFYIKTKDGKVYYSQYQTYSGILATYLD